jgi:hypothetical protein
MTTALKNLAAALTTTLLVFATGSAALGQARGRGGPPPDVTLSQRPCGDYYGSEYGTDCVEGVFGSLGRNTCAYRTGPPCGASRVPPNVR